MQHTQSLPGSVFVVGAAGFIGEGVARAFSRNGYVVYGLIRNQAQAKDLLLNEIIPVIGDGNDPSVYKSYVEKCQIIVDATLNFSDPTSIPTKLIKLAQETSAQDPLFPPKVFIYTSGIMVYGNDERIRDENWPLTDHSYARWRSGVERLVVTAKGITPIVLRPGWVFGRRFGAHGEIFEIPENNIVKIPGVHKDRRYSWVHVDDLGEAYVNAAKAGKRVAGEVFNIVGYDMPQWADLVTKAGTILGRKVEIEWTTPTTESQILRDSNVVLNPQKAIDLLGWRPKIFGLLENLDLYYSYYKASKSQ